MEGLDVDWVDVDGLDTERLDVGSATTDWINVASVNVDRLDVDEFNVDGLETGLNGAVTGGVDERFDVELADMGPCPAGAGVDAAGRPCGSSGADPREVTAIERLPPGRRPPVNRGR